MKCCESFKDDIWEAAESGHVPDSLAAHLDTCPSCRKEMDRARSAMDGFAALREVQAPIPSLAVRESISVPLIRFRLAWSIPLAAALLLVCALILPRLISRQSAPRYTSAVVRNTRRTMAPVPTPPKAAAVERPRPTPPAPSRLARIEKQPIKAAAKPIHHRKHHTASVPEIERPCPQVQFVPENDPSRVAVVQVADGGSITFIKLTQIAQPAEPRRSDGYPDRPTM